MEYCGVLNREALKIAKNETRIIKSRIQWVLAKLYLIVVMKIFDDDLLDEQYHKVKLRGSGRSYKTQILVIEWINMSNYI